VSENTGVYADMATDWVMPITRRQATKNERLAILKALQFPTQSEAKNLLALLDSVNSTLLIKLATRIIISSRACKAVPNPRNELTRIERISQRTEVSPYQALEALEKLKRQDSTARKTRPPVKKAIISKRDYQNLRSFFKHCIDLPGDLTMQERRKRFSIKLHRAFRLILTAYEISDDSKSIKIKSQFEKYAFQSTGFQFRAATNNNHSRLDDKQDGTQLGYLMSPYRG
jgi:Mn-dependent DtxR family transcriptional regulator